MNKNQEYIKKCEEFEQLKTNSKKALETHSGIQKEIQEYKRNITMLEHKLIELKQINHGTKCEKVVKSIHDVSRKLAMAQIFLKYEKTTCDKKFKQNVTDISTPEINISGKLESLETLNTMLVIKLEELKKTIPP